MDVSSVTVGTAQPVWGLRDELRRVWTNENRLVLVAPTGSGKTTQVCQMILRDGRNNGKQIVVLQPRRVAARTVARRVAEEMGVELGNEVGYQVRFEDAIASETRIAFVTEGILLRWLQDEPTLPHIGAILFDEFHERNLLSDIGLALVKALQSSARPDLLLMVMSATLDSTAVADYLDGCPILQAEGRAYPVAIRYQDWADERPVWELATEKVREVVGQSGEGDVLVFMPGAYEIQRTIEEIRHAHIQDDLLVIPLHGELSPQDQDRAFLPTPYRRVIVSTNVAETSVTLPGIRYVIDSGLARIARFDPRHSISTLHVEPISKASADQRAGRAGRLGPGECYRLWTEAQQQVRPERNTPEIQRTDLSGVVLLLHSFGITDAEHFDLLDKPDTERIRHAEELLEVLGAIATGVNTPEATALGTFTPPSRAITEVGRRMLRLPLHPRYARMLVEAERFECVREVALFAALVSGRDLLTHLNPQDRLTRRNRDSLTRVSDTDYDLLAASFAHAVRHRFDYKTCYSYGVNPHVAREVSLTYQQILELLGEEAGAADDVPKNEVRSEGIQRCHLVGFIDQLAARIGASEDFELANGRHGTLMQESVVTRSPLVVVSEIREITTRQQEKLTLIGIASAVRQEWLIELRPPQLTQTMEHVYNRLSKRVTAARAWRYRNLIVHAEQMEQVDPAAAAQVLAREFVRNPHPPSVPRWERELKPWLRKVERARQRSPELGLPEITDELISQTLAQAWHDATSFKEAADRPLLPAFEALLTPQQRASLDSAT
jgi:ATP-dependent helicase HrpB